MRLAVLGIDHHICKKKTLKYFDTSIDFVGTAN